MKKLFYIIRHGETDLNKQGIVQGRGVNTPLNDLGNQQAQAFYEAYQAIKFDKIYTSTLIRTHQTVANFINQGIPWEQLEGLDEISWGIYEGKEQSTNIITGFNSITQQWSEGKLDIAIEGGESPNQVQERQKKAMDYITSQPDERNVLICMHGRAMRILLCLLINKPLSQMDDFPHMNTALYLVSYNEGTFTIEDHYNINHLAQLQDVE
ncbi:MULTISPECIES: histidine phosphatase family protein [Olivibacter]|jgi:probable phosphoglycerate mutase|uniref:Phosphoglycerate mutase n=3 Tax=Sphingobacteriaceae TaxID=84566 RepID=F4C717_SPHS2|nr:MULTISPECIES: histidine phosphatase family protein [Olivibacter]MCL4639997.1 histidine phosphatase family protein [Olivibacter sp. UJ_SKK_5.1]MDM8175231.1 histidine phosphatase family protein [Olivibacter sp. 47]MDX3913091.1 histidine phosphatase family protein [Pseudosphingobacterium sp.]QEL01998.1 histidine phosphatase family protein [Olivibacter sp. LS-1]